MVADKARVTEVLREAGWYKRAHREADRRVGSGVEVAALADQSRAVSVDNEKGLAERAQEGAQISRMLRRAKLPASPASEDILRNYDGSFPVALSVVSLRDSQGNKVI